MHFSSSSSSQGDLKVDVDARILGYVDDVGELDGEARGLVQVVDGENL